MAKTHKHTPIVNWREKTLRNVLVALNENHDKTWADMEELTGVPGGTLHSIAHGGHIPRKWKSKFRHLAKQERPDLLSYPIADLRWMLENREEVTQTGDGR